MTKATLEQKAHHSRLEAAIESSWFRNVITSLIILNAVILGVLTYRASLTPLFVDVLDVIVLPPWRLSIGTTDYQATFIIEPPLQCRYSSLNWQ